MPKPSFFFCPNRRKQLGKVLLNPLLGTVLVTIDTQSECSVAVVMDLIREVKVR